MNPFHHSRSCLRPIAEQIQASQGADRCEECCINSQIDKRYKTVRWIRENKVCNKRSLQCEVDGEYLPLESGESRSWKHLITNFGVDKGLEDLGAQKYTVTQEVVRFELE
jgi:hypothetical protein